MGKQNKELESARAAKQQARKLYGDWEIVNGIGITYQDGAYAVKMNLCEELKEDQEVAQEIDGVPVVWKVVGEIKKQS